MPKDKTAKKEESFLDHLDLCEYSPCDEEEMSAAVHGLIEASTQQMQTAFELTKLIVGTNSDKTEEQVFAVYKKAAKVVSENYSLRSMLQDLEMH